MKKLFAIILLCAACFGAYAQDSSILEEWGDKKLELEDKDFITPLTYASFFYNYNFSAPEGLIPHGLGFEVATLFMGFTPWNGARLSLGLVDFALDFGYTQKGYIFSENAEGNYIGPANLADFDPKDAAMLNEPDCKWLRFGYMFPLAYTQQLGQSKWKAALVVSPGIGWNVYKNKYLRNGVTYDDTRRIKKDVYFRLEGSAYLWYNGIGFGVRYCFPQNFRGGGFLGAGISLGI